MDWFQVIIIVLSVFGIVVWLEHTINKRIDLINLKISELRSVIISRTDSHS